MTETELADLCAKLRERGPVRTEGHPASPNGRRTWQPLINPHGPEAADKLEALSGRMSMLTEALKKTTARCAQYADFIEHSVKGDDFELHPYFPQLQDEVAEGIAALAQTQSEG